MCRLRHVKSVPPIRVAPLARGPRHVKTIPPAPSGLMAGDFFRLPTNPVIGAISGARSWYCPARSASGPRARFFNPHIEVTMLRLKNLRATPRKHHAPGSGIRKCPQQPGWVTKNALTRQRHRHQELSGAGARTELCLRLRSDLAHVAGARGVALRGRCVATGSPVRNPLRPVGHLPPRSSRGHASTPLRSKGRVVSRVWRTVLPLGA